MLRTWARKCTPRDRQKCCLQVGENVLAISGEDRAALLNHARACDYRSGTLTMLPEVTKRIAYKPADREILRLKEGSRRRALPNKRRRTSKEKWPETKGGAGKG